MVKATRELHEAYDNPDKPTAFKLLTEYTQKLLLEHPYEKFSTPTLIESLRVVGAPSKDWKAAFVGATEYPDLDLNKIPSDSPIPDELIIVYDFASSSLLEQFTDVLHQGQTLDRNAPISASGVDLAAGSTDHWCPGTNSLDSFGVRTKARQTVTASALSGAGLRGGRVNVVIIDQGLHQASLPAANWGGGLISSGTPPGSADRTSHGMMIARSILDLAPDAILYDVPLVPEERIASVGPFLSSAHAAFIQLLLAILISRPKPRWSGPWILVNAWAIFDRSTESPLGDYTENTNGSPFGHPLIALVRLMTSPLNLDVIFAAGNCGEFCGSPRCGKLDRGPGRSIWGANALPEVITAGAVSSAETWIGASSQGPGPGGPRLEPRKPDLCAPSNFREDDDAAVLNSGTSAACAITAGVVAALRSNPIWYQHLVSAAQMRNALISSARQTQLPGWNGRLGHGILDAAGAMATL
jgi:hypothetical protein